MITIEEPITKEETHATSATPNLEWPLDPRVFDTYMQREIAADECHTLACFIRQGKVAGTTEEADRLDRESHRITFWDDKEVVPLVRRSAAEYAPRIAAHYASLRNTKAIQRNTH